jgi:hypothetical protein
MTWHNIQKNATRAGWRGWDAGKRLWQIDDAQPNNGATAFHASNGESHMWCNSLDEMSARLAATGLPRRRWTIGGAL